MTMSSSLTVLCHLAIVFFGKSSNKWRNLFPYPWSLTWPCDLLWSTECSGNGYMLVKPIKRLHMHFVHILETLLSCQVNILKLDFQMIHMWYSHFCHLIQLPENCRYVRKNVFHQRAKLTHHVSVDAYRWV